MYNTILVPIDILEDDLTDKMLPHVEALAKIDNPKIHFFTVIPNVEMFFGVEYASMPVSMRESGEEQRGLPSGGKGFLDTAIAPLGAIRQLERGCLQIGNRHHSICQRLSGEFIRNQRGGKVAQMAEREGGQIAEFM